MSADLEFPVAYYPALLQLGLTYRCNLECPHCYALYRRTRTELTTEEVQRLIDDALELGSCKVVYSHGENLIRSDFHQLARYIADRGMFQTLMTNGFFLQREDQVRRLEDTGINKVMISIDSDIESEHNANRGKANAFRMAVSAMQNLRKWSKLHVGISMAIDTRNYGRIRQVIELGESIGVEFVSLMQVRPNLPHTFAAYNWTTYEQLCRDMYDLILQYRGRIDVYTHDPFMITLLDERIGDEIDRQNFIAHNACNVGKYMMSICPDGEVTGCNFIERAVGNVRDASLREIWTTLVTEYTDDEWNEGPCGSCSKRKVCGTGCKAFHLPHDTRYDKRCDMVRFGEETPWQHETL